MRPGKFLAVLLAAALLLTTTACTLNQIVLPNAGTETADPAPASAPVEYTYRTAVTELPVCWSPAQWQTESEAAILNWTVSPLYTPVPLDEGWTLAPEMADREPVDVTADYAGSEVYGVPADAQTGYAYQIDLNPLACWSDGTPITAQDYLDSLETLLNSGNKYPRAEDFFSGVLQIAGAYDYYMQDQVGAVEYRSLADAGFASMEEAKAAGYTYFYLDMDGFWGLSCGWQPINSTTSYRDEAVIAGTDEDYVTPSYLYSTYLSPGAPYAVYRTSYVGVLERKVTRRDFSQVGIIATGEYQITLVLEVPLAVRALESALSTAWLIRAQDTAEYGTAPENTPSCGPYRVARVDDGGVYLTRNENWYGYSDGLHKDQYQADAIDCRYFETEESVQAAFDAGELDVAALSGGSVQIPQTYVTRLTCNSSLAILKQREQPGICKRILSLPEFRQALSLSLDREAFAALYPGSTPATGLLADCFRLDYVGGQVYRQTGPGEKAAELQTDVTVQMLIQQAYDTAVTRGWMDETMAVELELLVYSEDPVYEEALNLLRSAVSRACAGTSLENRVHILKTVDPHYDETTRSGQFELAFSTWGGTQWDPWRLLQCCCDEDLRLEFGFEPNVEVCTLRVNGAAETRTYRGWYEALTGGIYAGADRNVRLEVLAGLEKALLEEYCAIPLFQRSRSLAVSDRLSPGTAEDWPEDVRYLHFREKDR